MIDFFVVEDVERGMRVEGGGLREEGRIYFAATQIVGCGTIEH